MPPKPMARSRDRAIGLGVLALTLVYTAFEMVAPVLGG
jgi:hypothetical protein